MLRLLTRSGPPVVFALALRPQLAGLALILDGHRCHRRAGRRQALHARLSLSIGVAVLVADVSLQAVTLIQAADVALYQAKQADRARFVLTDNEGIAYG